MKLLYGSRGQINAFHVQRALEHRKTCCLAITGVCDNYKFEQIMTMKAFANVHNCSEVLRVAATINSDDRGFEINPSSPLASLSGLKKLLGIPSWGGTDYSFCEAFLIDRYAAFEDQPEMIPLVQIMLINHDLAYVSTIRASLLVGRIRFELSKLRVQNWTKVSFEPIDRRVEDAADQLLFRNYDESLKGQC